jgi:hypothetical protein
VPNPGKQPPRRTIFRQWLGEPPVPSSPLPLPEPLPPIEPMGVPLRDLVGEPLEAFQKAETIGAPGLGTHYVRPPNPDLLDLASLAVGPARPLSVAAADPYGAKTFEAGKGPLPITTAPETSGIRAFHGSPHDFDRFDVSKIGTGEGAQAYGHGLYFAEKEGTAKAYRDALSGGSTPTSDVARYWLDQAGGNVEEAVKQLRAYAPPSRETDAIVDYLLHPPGHMYEVNIKADPEHFLDWDKPLSEQPHIVEQLRQAGFQDAPWPYTGKLMHPDGGTFIDLNDTGDAAYRGMVNLIRDTGSRMPGARLDARASEELAKRGIPGIKYLDAGSRATGEGTRNYAIFNDQLIDILRKYGILPPLVGGGALWSLTGDTDRIGTPPPVMKPR